MLTKIEGIDSVMDWKARYVRMSGERQSSWSDFI